jgi:hypothetical protein
MVAENYGGCAARQCHEADAPPMQSVISGMSGGSLAELNDLMTIQRPADDRPSR